MLNSFGTNTWTLLAAAYELASFAGMKDMLNGYLDMGYEYICTCVIDANGIKSTMGLSGESNQIFASCSESGANAKVDAQGAKAAEEAKKKAAAAAAIVAAAKKKKIDETVTAMKALKGCDSLGTTANQDLCYNNLKQWNADQTALNKHLAYLVEVSGGATSTKNRTE